jgi:hypothetical protein
MGLLVVSPHTRCAVPPRSTVRVVRVAAVDYHAHHRVALPTDVGRPLAIIDIAAGRVGNRVATLVRPDHAQAAVLVAVESRLVGVRVKRAAVAAGRGGRLDRRPVIAALAYGGPDVVIIASGRILEGYHHGTQAGDPDFDIHGAGPDGYRFALHVPDALGGPVVVIDVLVVAAKQHVGAVVGAGGDSDVLAVGATRAGHLFCVRSVAVRIDYRDQPNHLVAIHGPPGHVPPALVVGGQLDVAHLLVLAFPQVSAPERATERVVARLGDVGVGAAFFSARPADANGSVKLVRRD